MDLVLGADVDASSRIVQKEDLRTAQEPPGQDYLLLVAPAEKLDFLVDRRRLDLEAFDFLLSGKL